MIQRSQITANVLTFRGRDRGISNGTAMESGCKFSKCMDGGWKIALVLGRSDFGARILETCLQDRC